MNTRVFACSLGAALGSLLLVAPSMAAPAAPSGAHPRLFLDAKTIATLKKQTADSSKGAAKAVAQCDDYLAKPGNWGSQDWDESILASSCALAFRATDNAKYVAPAVANMQKIIARGDAAVRKDSGYFIRVYAPYLAIAYDWLHDRAEVQALKGDVTTRFAAYFDWYKTSGYLPHRAGANYQAGFLFSATMMAIAASGDGAAFGPMWTTVVDELVGKDMQDASQPGGALSGGDWAEGWQYGPLSVMEYALVTRGLEEQGVQLPYMEKYLSEIVLRHLYGTVPDKSGIFVAGDYDSENAVMPLPVLALQAVLAGPAAIGSKAWARGALTGMKADPTPLFRVFNALADASEGEVTPFPTSSPTAYATKSTRVVFARGSWDATSPWGAFMCGPRLVDDHQHVNAGNWLFSRGSDHLVVDPTPYGSRSTLNGNAPAVASKNIPGSPSQQWALLGRKTDLTWVRSVAGGIVAARGDYSDQFSKHDNTDDTDVPSDVPTALRDWVFFPYGGDATTVIVDRVQTGDAARGAFFRIRTPAKLALSGASASGTTGKSSVHLRTVWASDGAPSVRTPSVSGGCSDDLNGQCDVARFKVDEYRLDVKGPNAGAITVIDGAAAATAAPSAQALSGTGFRGTTFARGTTRYVVVSSDSPDALPAAKFEYVAPSAAIHVALDVPTGNSGRSDVAVAPSGTNCKVTATAHDGADGGYVGKPLMVMLNDKCELKEIGEAPLGVDPGTGQPAFPNPAAPGSPGDPGDTDGGASGSSGSSASKGCGCRVTAASGDLPFVGVALAGLVVLARRRSSRPSLR